MQHGSLLDGAAAIDRLKTLDEIWRHTCAVFERQLVEFVIYFTVAADRSAPFLFSTMALHGTEAPPKTVFDPFLDHCCRSYAMT